MPFGMVGWTGPGMRQVEGFGIYQWEGVIFGGKYGTPIETSWEIPLLEIPTALLLATRLVCQAR